MPKRLMSEMRVAPSEADTLLTSTVNTSARVSDLPSPLIESAGRRLGLMSLLLATGCLMAQGMFLVTAYILHWRDPNSMLAMRLTMLGLLVISAGMFTLSRSRRIDPTLLLDVGLVYSVAGALGLSLQVFFKEEPWAVGMTRVPWLCVWIVLFPVVVPSPPRKSITTSVLCGLTLPVALALWLGAGNPMPPAKALVFNSVPVAFCVCLAVLPAKIIHSLGTKLKAAHSEIHRLGSYRLVKLIKTGGMGQVWRAEHAMLARPAAIKLIKPSGNRVSSKAEQRFAREAAVTAALRCPHTVQLYDYGLTPDGSLYYVMELLDGLDLQSLVSKYGPLPPHRVAHILAQTCESLAEAHEAGLVHRDIKPANIYLCRVGLAFDFVKLLDFGLVTAERSSPDDAMDPHVTDPGTFIGTPGFCAPEQINHGKIDARSDLYSLGCVAYWLLSGQMVFDDRVGTAGQLVAHVHEQPEPLSKRSPQPVPPELEQIIMDCLKKSPDDRPRSAHHLGKLLAPVRLDAPWSQANAKLWWQQAGILATEVVSGSDHEESRD